MLNPGSKTELEKLSVIPTSESIISAQQALLGLIPQIMVDGSRVVQHQSLPDGGGEGIVVENGRISYSRGFEVDDIVYEVEVTPGGIHVYEEERGHAYYYGDGSWDAGITLLAEGLQKVAMILADFYK